MFQLSIFASSVAHVFGANREKLFESREKLSPKNVALNCQFWMQKGMSCSWNYQKKHLKKYGRRIFLWITWSRWNGERRTNALITTTSKYVRAIQYGNDVCFDAHLHFYVILILVSISIFSKCVFRKKRRKIEAL